MASDGVFKGAIFNTNKSGAIEIIKYKNHKEVLVRFLSTGYKTICSVSNIRSGRVKDRLLPSVYGIGYLGVGNHKSSIGGVTSAKYKVWLDMIRRCYDETFQKRNPSYIGCSVCEEWHNFQNFSDWYDDNYPEDGVIYQLDKDKIIKGNRVYSPVTCCFLTHSENSAVSNQLKWEFISPSGDTVKVINLNKFCAEMNLKSSAMHRVHSGKSNHHKGWRLFK